MEENPSLNDGIVPNLKTIIFMAGYYCFYNTSKNRACRCMSAMFICNPITVVDMMLIKTVSKKNCINKKASRILSGVCSDGCYENLQITVTCNKRKTS